MWYLVAILLLGLGTTDLRAQLRVERGGFVVLQGADTLAVERFSRTGTRLEGELFDRTIAHRWEYVIRYDRRGQIARLETTLHPAAAPPGTFPSQQARITFRADTAIAEVASGGELRTERLLARTGAIPYLNLSFALLEEAIARAQTSESHEVPLFFVVGGQTLSAAVERQGTDSATVTLGGVEIRVAVDRAGRLQGGQVPAQDLSFARVARVAEEALRTAPPSYSAPPGASYTAESVWVNTLEGHTLAGTLTLPKERRGRVPAVVLISGSGPQDRDQALPTVPDYRPFRQIADALSRRGIAVLRLDDRGVGESTGTHATATTADFAQDVRAALAYLRQRREIDRRRLGLIGHSEGGAIAQLVAVRGTWVSAVVLMAAPSRTGRRIIAEQNRFMIESSAAPAAAHDSLLAAAVATVDSLAARRPWLRFFLNHDPLPTAGRLRVPVLILHGATDRQVSPEQAEELASAIRAGGKAEVTVRLFPGLNHLFLPDPDGHPQRYAALPSREVPPEVLGAVADWLVERLR